ncbi:MAG: 50S ribosomal protein L2, partial [Patescibacteria group bacterium]
MGIRIYKPTTPGRRHTSVETFEEVTAKSTLRRKLVVKNRTGGRNNQGKITVRHHGGGAKQFYRLIDFKQDKFDIPGVITAVEYDPNRTVRIAAVTYADGDKRYILLVEGLAVGSQVLSSRQTIKPAVGVRMPLELIPLGEMVCNIELTPGKGGAMIRSAGGAAQLMAVEGKFAQLKLSSGEVRLVPKTCLATIGQLAGQHRRNIRIGKAMFNISFYVNFL